MSNQLNDRTVTSDRYEKLVNDSKKLDEIKNVISEIIKTLSDEGYEIINDNLCDYIDRKSVHEIANGAAWIMINASNELSELLEVKDENI